MSDDLKAVQVRISGRVQGVSFRYWTQQEARRAGLTGWVRNEADGSVRVLNRGFDTGKNDWRQAEGKALFTGDANTASLKVSFFGPFYGGYHVAALDANYQWALVVGPDRSYCWILSRTTQLPPGVREQLIARAQALGIDTQALIWVTHERTDPQP